MTAPKPTLGYSPLTGTTYVLLRNGQKRAVPEPEVVAVIAGYLDDHHLSVTKPDGTVVRYGVLDNGRAETPGSPDQNGSPPHGADR